MTDLLSLLRDIQNYSQQLYDCLILEKQMLDNNQLKKLAEISSQKQTLLEQLDQLDKLRSAAAGGKNFKGFIADSKDQPLIKQWNTTRKIIASCQQQNEINGRLINKRSMINQDILSILSGRDKQADETYNAHGNQVTSTSLFNGIKA